MRVRGVTIEEGICKHRCGVVVPPTPKESVDYSPPRWFRCKCGVKVQNIRGWDGEGFKKATHVWNAAWRPPIFCSNFGRHLERAQVFKKRPNKKAGARKKRNIRLSWRACQSCPHGLRGNDRDNQHRKLWMKYAVVVCDLGVPCIERNPRTFGSEMDDAALPIRDAMAPPPEGCPYEMEHMIESEKLTWE